MADDFDDIVNSIMRSTGLTDRSRAERIAVQNGHRRQVVDPVVAERERLAVEKHEQWEIVKLFRSFGCTVYVLSQPRAAKQTPGLADLYVQHRSLGRAWWFETKRQVGGHVSPAQQDFADGNRACGVGSFIGDRHDATELLITLGLVERTEHGILEPVRRPRAHAG
jgi:hypothetical protein